MYRGIKISEGLKVRHQAENMRRWVGATESRQFCAGEGHAEDSH